MKNKLMLIGLSAMLSVGMSNASIDAMVIRAQERAVQYQAHAQKTVEKHAAELENTPIVLDTTVFDAQLAEQKANFAAGVEDTSMLKRSKNLVYRTQENIKSGYQSTLSGSKAGYSAVVASAVSAKNSIVNGSVATYNTAKFAIANPSDAASLAWIGTKHFGSTVLDSARKTGSTINGYTFGKDLGYFKHDGAVASTAVIAGLVGGTYVIYKNGYVSKLKKALVGKFSKTAAPVEEVTIPVVEVKAPVKRVRIDAYQTPKKAVKRVHRRK